MEPVAGGENTTLDVDVVLVAVGRRPNTEGLGLEGLGIALDGQGRIEVNERFETGVPGVYAIGDVVAGPMLAHKAEEEGIAVAEIIAGGSGHVNHATIPRCRLHRAGGRDRGPDRGSAGRRPASSTRLAASPSPPNGGRGRCR